MTGPRRKRSSKEQESKVNQPLNSDIDVNYFMREDPAVAEPTMTVEQAVAELLRRQRARDSLVEYASAIDIPGAPVKVDTPDEATDEVFKPIETRVALHHRVILEACQRCLETDMGRLMIFAPPGSAKSTYASVVTPVWAMQKWKGFQIILASYGSDLARKHARKARALAKQDRAIAIWEDRPTLNTDQRAVDNWSLSNGSSYMAAGLLAGITGNRADCFVGETLVTTSVGQVRIDAITRNHEVLAYDHDKAQLTYRRVLATRRILRRGLVRVVTANGRQFVSTPEHRVFVPGRGYTQAALLEQKDPLHVANTTVRRFQDRVALVERLLDREEFVYDVQVEGTNNFFAEGVLVHNCAIIDDPVAGRKEADSEADQGNVEDAFRDDVKSRLKPKASIILIQTRWSEKDLSGTILPEDYDGRSGSVLCRDGQVWEVLNIPAEAERPDDPLNRKPGEFLWPEWFPQAHWLMHKNDPRGQRTWASLYQQRPTAADGIEFKREWAKWYDPDLPPGTPAIPGNPPGRPKHLTKYGATDFATKEDRSADFSEHGVMGHDRDGAVWLLDWWSGQKTTDVVVSQWIMLLKRHGPVLRWWHEGGPIGNAMTPTMMAEQRRHKAYTVLEPKTSIKNKAVKLASFQALMASGQVWFPLRRPWATRLLDQLCAFPSGRYDDAADVAGLFGRGVNELAFPLTPSEDRKPQLIPYTSAWLEYEEKDESAEPRYF